MGKGPSLGRRFLLRNEGHYRRERGAPPHPPSLRLAPPPLPLFPAIGGSGIRGRGEKEAGKALHWNPPPLACLLFRCLNNKGSQLAKEEEDVD